jgi:hypothetical protein
MTHLHAIMASGTDTLTPWRIWCIPGPHAKSENIRPARRLTIEATVRL